MDPITHAISGAALAKFLPKKHLTRAQLEMLVVLTMLPDADIILRLFSDTLYLTHHRGITHSLLMLPLWTWLLASLLPRFRHGMLALPWWILAAAIILHISLDMITSFGTMILAPLSDWRATFDLVFIIDPLFTSLLLLPLVATLVWKQHARLLATSCLLLVVCYLILCAIMHQRALELAHSAMPEASDVAALPLPLSPFRWRLLALSANKWYLSDVDFVPVFNGINIIIPIALQKKLNASLSKSNALHWRHWPTMDASLTPQQQSLSSVEWYRWFARFPVLLSNTNTTLEFGDLRFAIAPTSHMPFRFRLQLKPRPQGWLVMHNGKTSVIE